MYPYLSDLFKDLLGIELPFPIYSFGAMVALGTLTAGWLLGKELDRFYRAGRLNGVRVPAESQKKDQKNGKGARRRSKGTVVVSPSQVVWTIAIIAVATGFAGAKLFHILENMEEFSRDPARMIFSTGGFTFYGGLIGGALGVIWYIRRNDLSISIFADAVAPGLMIAYGIGRLGCHLAGDGDWGIPSNIAARPNWIPTWLWAETYSNNILGRDLSAAPVYPTPIYEFIMGMAIFAILWSVRKHPFKAGWLFSLYLVLNGLERYLIEQIRVNNVFTVFGFELTQAEIIAMALIGLGIVGLIKTTRKRSDEASEGTAAGDDDRGA